MSTPWERAKRRQGYEGHERDLAEGGGKRQINSGRVWFSKRDAFNKYLFLVDGKKRTKLRSLSINVDDLKKLTKDAFFHQTLPALAVCFERENENWIMIRQIDFDHMQDDLLILQEELRDLRKSGSD